MLRKEHHNVQSTALDAASDEVLYKIDIPANRYDMLCLEGISRALNVFLGRCPPPSFSVVPPQQGVSSILCQGCRINTTRCCAGHMQRITVQPETLLVRPFIVAAVLRDVTFDQRRYQSFIDLQDKLHTTLCRQRSLVAIGTHDLDTLQGPFTYEALPPEQIQFVPLKQTRTFDAGSLMQHYLANDNKLRKYVPIIQDSIVYPVIYDAQRTVLSLPPIINGQHSAVRAVVVLFSVAFGVCCLTVYMNSSHCIVIVRGQTPHQYLVKYPTKLRSNISRGSCPTQPMRCIPHTDYTQDHQCFH